LSNRVERKLQHVAIAEFRYRHEAELAAGFLADAGIPYRLQTDDAGGANFGLSMLRPAILWVRALDAQEARELVTPEELESEPDPEPVGLAQPVRRAPTTSGGPLSVRERSVAGALALALLVTAPSLPPAPLQPAWVALCYVGGFALLGVAAVGRAPGPLERLLSMLSGSPPR
jgi:hypothetical protein